MWHWTFDIWFEIYIHYWNIDNTQMKVILTSIKIKYKVSNSVFVLNKNHNPAMNCIFTEKNEFKFEPMHHSKFTKYNWKSRRNFLWSIENHGQLRNPIHFIIIYEHWFKTCFQKKIFKVSQSWYLFVNKLIKWWIFDIKYRNQNYSNFSANSSPKYL